MFLGGDEPSVRAPGRIVGQAEAFLCDLLFVRTVQFNGPDIVAAATVRPATPTQILEDAINRQGPPIHINKLQVSPTTPTSSLFIYFMAELIQKIYLRLFPDLIRDNSLLIESFVRARE